MKVRELMAQLRALAQDGELYIAQPKDLEGGLVYIPFEGAVATVTAKWDGEYFEPVTGPSNNAKEISVLERKKGRTF